jgi:hypothetical protein
MPLVVILAECGACDRRTGMPVRNLDKALSHERSRTAALFHDNRSTPKSRCSQRPPPPNDTAQQRQSTGEQRSPNNASCPAVGCSA